MKGVGNGKLFCRIKELCPRSEEEEGGFLFVECGEADFGVYMAW